LRRQNGNRVWSCRRAIDRRRGCVVSGWTVCRLTVSRRPRIAPAQSGMFRLTRKSSFRTLPLRRATRRRTSAASP